LPLTARDRTHEARAAAACRWVVDVIANSAARDDNEFAWMHGRKFQSDKPSP